MSDNGGLAIYMLYQSLRLHFTSKSYDYFKYHGKTNTSKESFLTNKNKYTFYKLSRKYTVDEFKNFVVANFIVGDVKWAGDLLTEDAEENYRKWQSRTQSLTYKFETDLTYLFDKYEAVDLISVKDNVDFPILLQEVMSNNICIETLLIMNDLMNFFPMWERKIEDDLFWPEWKRKCLKYTPFLEYDKMKFRTIIKRFL